MKVSWNDKSIGFTYTDKFVSKLISKFSLVDVAHWNMFGHVICTVKTYVKPIFFIYTYPNFVHIYEKSQWIYFDIDSFKNIFY